MRKLYFAIIQLVISAAYAQINENTLAPEIMPANPQAFQFTPYGDIPMGKYSGTPNISIPLYIIEAKGLQIPIELTYASNGIKVNEEAGWTGLGWDLSAEGSIVQNVIGSDDYGHYKRRILPNLNCILTAQSPVSPASVWAANQVFFLNQDNLDHQDEFDACLFEPQYANGLYDTSPDKFTFNFLNYSGEFVLDWQTGQFECVTDKNIKIYSSSSNSMTLPSTIVIRVPEGHRFLFELKEETQTVEAYTFNESGPAISPVVDLTKPAEKASRVYKLIQIYTNQNDLIQYNYMMTSVSKNLPNISRTITDYKQTVPTSMVASPLVTQRVTTCLGTEQAYAVLSSITFKTGTVNFITSSRTDLKEAKKLDRIEIRNFKDEYVKDIVFSYSYFTATTGGTNWDNHLNFTDWTTDKTANELSQRLKLLSVGETGLKPYVFAYSTINLPKKTSNATDYWGYYNGYTSNVSFYPNIYAFNIEGGNVSYFDYEGNNKGANISYCKAGILEKMTYPTGGFTTLEWEMNTFDNIKIPPYSQGQLKGINLTTVPGPNALLTKVINLETETIFTGNAFLSTRGCTDPNAYANCFVNILVFKPELLQYLEAEANMSNGLTYALASEGFLDGTSPLYDDYLNDVITLKKLYNDPLEVIYNNLQYTLPKGIIVFKASGGCGVYNGTSNNSQATFNLSYREYLPLPLISNGGGLRIKSISSATGLYESVVKKNYTYNGGKLMSPLIFFNQKPYRYQWQFSYGDGWTIEAFTGYKRTLSTSSFVSPSQSAMGRYVGYDNVIETRVAAFSESNTIGGETEYFYNSPVTSIAVGAGAYTEINIPVAIKLPGNGTAKIRETFNSAGQVTERLTFTHVSVINDVNWGVRTADGGNFLEQFSGLVQFHPRYLVGVYPIISGQSLLTKMVKENMLYTSASSFTTISQTEEFQYDIQNQLSYHKLTGSSGDVIEKYFSYPYSFTSSDSNFAVLQQMSLNNTITPQVEVKSRVNSSLTSTERHTYYRRLVGNTSQKPDVFNISSSKILKGSQLSGKLVNFKYDSSGNVIETEIDNKITSYVWGYKESVPVAEVAGLSYNTIPPNLIGDLQLKTNTGSESQILTSLSNIRTTAALATGLITTITYKPLIGPSSIVDPKGYRLSYFYDSVGRLEFVKDSNGFIVSEYHYNYKP